uniref:Uncharacterized protein n=1 Tax=Hyaloperonospora arabidopsidis (strain Emoy2) TaxID=559515 RepID=M4C0Q4_HYAAE
MSRARKATFPPASLDVPVTPDEGAASSMHVREPDVLRSSSARTVCGSTTRSHPRSSPPAQQAQLQLPTEHRKLCSQSRRHRPGCTGRQRYHREGLSSVVYAKGQMRWIVDRMRVMRTLTAK